MDDLKILKYLWAVNHMISVDFLFLIYSGAQTGFISWLLCQVRVHARHIFTHKSAQETGRTSQFYMSHVSILVLRNSLHRLCKVQRSVKMSTYY